MYTILGPPRQVPSHAICGPTQVRFLAYYMGAPSDQFLHLLWRPRSYVFFSYYMEPLGSFLCILYWGPQITFFAYYMRPLRSVSSHTIWGPLSDQFHCLLYAPPPSDQFLCMLWGGGGHLTF